MDDTYFTIACETEAEIKRKGSRFIAETRLVTSVDAAGERLTEIRKREHAATHHCFAYIVGDKDDSSFKYSDDGEPSGTAGRPIYDAVCGRDLTNLLLVVTRYFGGTKLGTGGLVRAYGDAAHEVLEKSGLKTNYLTETIRGEIAFPLYDQLMRVVNRLEVKQHDADFSDHVSLMLEVRRSRRQNLIDEITQLSGGKAKIEPIES